MLESSLRELDSRGWVCLPGISRKEALFDLAGMLGCPVSSPTGELIKELRPTASSLAWPNTLSAAHGTGAFPLHTDTAFWTTPARYVVLRARGDIRRHTIIRSFHDCFEEGGARLRILAERSVWLARTGACSFYCSMSINLGNTFGWRYDSQCMLPANNAALEVSTFLKDLIQPGGGECIEWEKENAVVLSNWLVMHGRGPAPDDEHGRVLERIYVR